MARLFVLGVSGNMLAASVAWQMRHMVDLCHISRLDSRLTLRLVESEFRNKTILPRPDFSALRQGVLLAGHAKSHLLLAVKEHP